MQSLDWNTMEFDEKRPMPAPSVAIDSEEVPSSSMTCANQSASSQTADEPRAVGWDRYIDSRLRQFSLR